MKTKLLFIAALGLISIKGISQNSNLIAQYSFTGNANDSIGSNNGIVHGATPCVDRFGSVNSAYNFNAVNTEYIEFPITPLTKANYTYTAWVLLNSYPTSGGRFVILSIGGTGGDQGITLGNNYNGGGTIYNGFGNYSYYNNGTILNIATNTGTLPSLNTWHQVVAVRDSSYAKLYIDGVLVSTSASSSGSLPIYGTSNQLATVGTRFNQTLPFDGKIDDIGIFKCALSASQVDSIFYAQSPNGCLIAAHPFTGNANDTIGSNNGIVNGPTLTTDRFGNANSAYNFNAANTQYIQFPITPLKKTNYSYSAWVLLNSYPSSGGRFVILSIGGSGGDQGISFANNYNAGGTIYNGFGNYSYFNNGTITNIGTNAGILAALNSWHHLVAVRDSSYAKLYIDGVLVNTSPSSSGSLPIYGTSNQSATVGTRFNQTLPFNGKIDDVEIYGCALSADEVSSIYITQRPSTQITITSPTNGANINSLCDFKFCVKDSIGEVGTNSPVYISNSNILGGGTFQTLPYNIGTSGILSSFCLTNTTYSFTSGIHNFYLWHSTFGVFEVIDSVALNIVNPINDLCSSLSFSRTPITNIDYQFSVTGLDTNETYTLRLHSFNGPVVDSIVVSGVTSGSLTKLYPPHDGVYYPVYSVTSSCGDYCDDSTGASLNITNVCPSYSSIAQGGFQNTAICSSDSAIFSGIVNYTNLFGSDTSSVIINWGDGISETHLIPTDTNGLVTILYNHLYNNPGVYTALLKFYNDSACFNDSLITTLNVTICGNLIGNIYNDINNNCTNNTGELGMAGISVELSQGSNTYIAWTDTLGNYVFNTLPAGAYIIQINNLHLGYTITCGNSLPHTINLTSGNTTSNFAIYCNGFDIAVAGMSLLNGFVPGQTDAVIPFIGIFNNTCNIALPGQVKIILSPCLTYTTICPWGNVHPSPTHVLQSNTGDTLVWDVNDITNFGTFGYFDYFAHVTTCTSAQVGDIACVTVMVLPTTGDADTSNNIFTECFEIGVSFDPNNKEVIPKGNGVNGDIPINTPDLTYTINFQNTGTATAYNIYLLDTISANLDINSIEIISSSHPMVPYLLSDGTMKFMFANIMLADSTHDEEHSHGYVTYRIKLNSGLTAGMQIKNTAYIYFDYNSPVVTNTTINTIETLSGIQNMNIDRLFKVYPNPANDKLIVRVDKNGSNYIVITDVLGKKVKQLKTTELQTEINVSDLQSGIYFIQLSKENVNSVQKIVIRK